MKLLLIPLIMAISILGYAQPTYEWNIHNGSSNDDYGRGIAMDPSGNIIAIGTFWDTLTLDVAGLSTTMVSNGNVDTYVQKLDPNGNTLWALSFGDLYNDVARAITTDASGNIYIAGDYKGIVDMDPGAGVSTISSNGETDVFILKLDPSGNFVWAHAIGDSDYERAFAIHADMNDEVYVTGFFGDTVDFDPGPGIAQRISNGVYDAFVLKFDTNGNFLWVNNMGGSDYDIALSVTSDAQNNCIVGGYFSDTVDFDPGATSFFLNGGGGTDVFVEKFSSTGSFIWATGIGDSLDQSVRAITCDMNDNIYLAGSLNGTVDFDNGVGQEILASAGGVDIFVQKLNPYGQHVWAYNAGSAYDDRGRSITVDTLGNVYVVGDFSGVVDFDPGPGSTTLQADTLANALVWTFDTSGVFKWAESVGSVENDGCFGIATDNNGNLYMTGIFQDTVDFDIDGNNDEFYSMQGTLDAFITKWSQDCLILIDTSVTNVGWGELTANQDNASYQWLDCDNNMAPVGATTQNFWPGLNGNYAVEITIGNCVDTSNCHYIEPWGLNEIEQEGLSIYPNPTTGEFTVKWANKLDKGVVRIYSIDGTMIDQITTQESTSINLEINAAPGIYIIEVSTADWISKKRIIKH